MAKGEGRNWRATYLTINKFDNFINGEFKDLFKAVETIKTNDLYHLKMQVDFNSRLQWVILGAIVVGSVAQIIWG